MSDDLPRRLRVTAEEYRPDGERMWARVTAGMTEPEAVQAKPTRSRFRVPHLAVATGVAVVLIGAVVLVGYRIGPGTGPPAAAETSSVGAEDPTTSASEETNEEDRGDQDGPVSVPPAPEAVDELDFLDVEGAVNDGGNDYWSQSDLLVTVVEPVYELAIELRVAIGDDVEATGSWTTADHYFEPAEVTEEDGYLVFRWTLSEGGTLAPGEYTLAGQYNHGDGPRDYGDDYYEFDAVAAAADGVIVGGFENP